MLQTIALIDSLKSELKAAGKTYADVATVLGLSEASVKRLFSDKNLSLHRLELICDAIDLSFTDLITRMGQQQQRRTCLTREQEAEIAGDLVLLMVAVSVVSGFTYEELIRQYALPETECIRKLAQLDRLELIELLPGNRIRLRVAPNFNWLPNGPIQRFFQENVVQDFFRSRFDKQGENLLVLNAILSPAACEELQRKMQSLASDFNQLMKQEASLPLNDRKGTSMVLALRQWQYSLFNTYRRKN